MKPNNKMIKACMIGSIGLSLFGQALIAHAADKFGLLADIAEVCSTQATCETDARASMIDFYSEVNPYDVIYDYGEAYDAYVDACDWSLVFDADYYAKTFPVLATQYHDDEDLLLMHFQTVGIHEGRQGSESFNVAAYFYNCSDDVYNAFKKNYAAYYIYYMLNYDTEKSVNTVTANNGKETMVQCKQILTWYQKRELAEVNKYREEVESEPVKFDSEMAAFANYRAYLNAHDGYKAHDWLADNYGNGDGVSGKLVEKMTTTGYSFSENTLTFGGGLYGNPKKIAASSYYESPEHYEAMVDPDNLYIGISNINWGTWTIHGDYRDIHKFSSSQFDVYLNSKIDTPMHPAG